LCGGLLPRAAVSGVGTGTEVNSSAETGNAKKQDEKQPAAAAATAWKQGDEDKSAFVSYLMPPRSYFWVLLRSQGIITSALRKPQQQQTVRLIAKTMTSETNREPPDRMVVYTMPGSQVSDFLSSAP
jgi:hypothetical protein